MKRTFLLFLPFLLLLVGAFISCEEVEEAGIELLSSVLSVIDLDTI